MNAAVNHTYREWNNWALEGNKASRALEILSEVSDGGVVDIIREVATEDNSKYDNDNLRELVNSYADRVQECEATIDKWFQASKLLLFRRRAVGLRACKLLHNHTMEKLLRTSYNRLAEYVNRACPQHSSDDGPNGAVLPAPVVNIEAASSNTTEWSVLANSSNCGKLRTALLPSALPSPAASEWSVKSLTPRGKIRRDIVKHSTDNYRGTQSPSSVAVKRNSENRGKPSQERHNTAVAIAMLHDVQLMTSPNKSQSSLLQLLHSALDESTVSAHGIMVGDRVRVRNNITHTWLPGIVTEIGCGNSKGTPRPLVNGRYWSFIEQNNHPDIGFVSATASKGTILMVRDYPTDDWKRGVVTDMLDGTPIVSLNGSSNGFIWNYWSHVTAEDMLDITGRVANQTDSQTLAETNVGLDQASHTMRETSHTESTSSPTGDPVVGRRSSLAEEPQSNQQKVSKPLHSSSISSLTNDILPDVKGRCSLLSEGGVIIEDVDVSKVETPESTSPTSNSSPHSGENKNEKSDVPLPNNNIKSIPAAKPEVSSPNTTSSDADRHLTEIDSKTQFSVHDHSTSQSPLTEGGSKATPIACHEPEANPRSPVDDQPPVDMSSDTAAENTIKLMPCDTSTLNVEGPAVTEAVQSISQVEICSVRQPTSCTKSQREASQQPTSDNTEKVEIEEHTTPADDIKKDLITKVTPQSEVTAVTNQTSARRESQSKVVEDDNKTAEVPTVNEEVIPSENTPVERDHREQQQMVHSEATENVITTAGEPDVTNSPTEDIITAAEEPKIESSVPCVEEETVRSESAEDKMTTEESSTAASTPLLNFDKSSDRMPTTPAKEGNPTALVEEVNSTTPVGEGNPTALVEEVNSTTPVEEANSTAPVEEGNPTASVEEGNSTTPVGEGNPTALVEEVNSTAPVEEVNSTAPVEEGNSTTPVEEANSTTPVGEGNPTALVEEVNSTTPVEEGNPTALVEEANSTTPVEEGNPTALVEEVNSTAPVEEVNSTAPVEEGNSTTPVEEANSTAPVEEVNSTAPVEEGNLTTPVGEGNPTALVEEVNSTAPVEEGNSTTPVEEGNPTAPVEEVNSTTPVEEGNPTALVEEANSTTPVGEGNPTALVEEVNSTTPVEEGNPTALVEEANSTTPVGEGNPTALVEEVNSTAPVEEVNSTAPVEEGNSTTPVEEANSTAPVEEVNSTAPVEEGNLTTPVGEGNPTALVEEVNSTAPVEEGNSTTPVEEGNPTAPVEEVNSTTPVEEGNPTALVEEANSTTPVGEGNPTALVEEVNSTAPVEEGNSTTPVEEANSTASVEEVNSTTPVEEVNSTTSATDGNHDGRQEIFQSEATENEFTNAEESNTVPTTSVMEDRNGRRETVKNETPITLNKENKHEEVPEYQSNNNNNTNITPTQTRECQSELFESSEGLTDSGINTKTPGVQAYVTYHCGKYDHVINNKKHHQSDQQQTQLCIDLTRNSKHQQVTVACSLRQTSESSGVHNSVKINKNDSSEKMETRIDNSNQKNDSHTESDNLIEPDIITLKKAVAEATVCSSLTAMYSQGSRLPGGGGLMESVYCHTNQDLSDLGSLRRTIPFVESILKSDANSIVDTSIYSTTSVQGVGCKSTPLMSLVSYPSISQHVDKEPTQDPASPEFRRAIESIHSVPSPSLFLNGLVNKSDNPVMTTHSTQVTPTGSNVQEKSSSSVEPVLDVKTQQLQDKNCADEVPKRPLFRTLSHISPSPDLGIVNIEHNSGEGLEEAQEEEEEPETKEEEEEPEAKEEDHTDQPHPSPSVALIQPVTAVHKSSECNIYCEDNNIQQQDNSIIISPSKSRDQETETDDLIIKQSAAVQNDWTSLWQTDQTDQQVQVDVNKIITDDDLRGGMFPLRPPPLPNSFPSEKLGSDPRRTQSLPLSRKYSSGKQQPRPSSASTGAPISWLREAQSSSSSGGATSLTPTPPSSSKPKPNRVMAWWEHELDQLLKTQRDTPRTTEYVLQV